MYSYDRRASQDVEVDSISFVRTDYALPELLEYDRPFKLHPHVTFTLKGPTLARVLEQKEEDVGEFLRGKTKDDILPVLRSSRELLAALTPVILERVQTGLLHSTPNRPKKMDVDYSGSQQSTLKVNIRKRLIQVGMRFDVTGE